MNNNFDLIIVGGGPAGLSAGLYATRGGVETLLLDKSSIGGQAMTTDRVENYPGFTEPIPGAELMKRMRRQAEGFGLKIEEFTSVSVISPATGFKIELSSADVYHSTALIIATGAEPRCLDVPGSQRLRGRGISYCATCDGPLFKDMPVLVVGGGNAAIEEALFLQRFASRVYIAHRRDKLRADAILQKRVFSEKNIELLWNSVVEEIIGKDRVERVMLKDVVTGGLFDLNVSGIFVYIGTVPNTDLVKGIIELDDKGYIITDTDMRTSLPGVFAAGDCRHKKLRQIVTAACDGATAAMMVYHYLQGLGN